MRFAPAIITVAVILIADSAFSIPTQTTSQITNAAAVKAQTAAGGQPTVVRSVIPLEVFKSAGLSKLTAQEMSNLNRWLEEYTDALTNTLADATPSFPGTDFSNTVNPSDVIESRIDGEFDGYHGQTMFKLENGQMWKQISYAVSSVHAYRPAVIIFRQASGYRMKVEGTEGTIMVRHVKAIYRE